MSAGPILPDPSCLTLDRLTLCNGTILFQLRTIPKTAPCLACGAPAERVHSYYQRTLTDLPWQGNAVRMQITVRKLFCDNLACQRRIFAEPLPSVAQRYARKTVRLTNALLELALLTGGEAAARIARAFGLAVSADALLRILKNATLPNRATPRVLGVWSCPHDRDDFAFRRGRNYGAILIDLEKHCPVDLLPRREAAPLAQWLKEHPGVQIVSRDRSFEFAQGIQEGASEAIQVADRFHLVKNLREMLERIVERNRHHLKGTTLPFAPCPATGTDLPPPAGPFLAATRGEHSEHCPTVGYHPQHGLPLLAFAR